MKKIVRSKIVLVILIVLSFGIYPFLLYLESPNLRNENTIVCKLGAYFFDKNTYFLEGDQAKIDKLKIIWSSDEDEQIIVASGGVFRNGIRNVYGKNTFDIFYEEKKIKSIHQFKENWWHVHNYSFSIRQVNDSLVMNVQAIGPDAYNKTFLLKSKI